MNNEKILELYNTIIENKDNQTIVNENFDKLLKYAIDNKDKEITNYYFYNYTNELTTYNDLNELQYVIIAMKKLLVQHDMNVDLIILSNWNNFSDTFSDRIVNMNPKNI